MARAATTSVKDLRRQAHELKEVVASAYLSGTNTRRVRQALAVLFRGTIGKDTVSSDWRWVKGKWDAWNSVPSPTWSAQGASSFAVTTANRQIIKVFAAVLGESLQPSELYAPMP